MRDAVSRSTLRSTVLPTGVAHKRCLSHHDQVLSNMSQYDSLLRDFAARRGYLSCADNIVP
eukprot:scaffold34427_cov38-Prasinocladus_malaysianus.AAC.2